MVEFIRIEGLRELDEALKELPKATARNVLLRTLQKEGKPIADEAARRAPDDPETGGKDLKSSIVIRSVPKKFRTAHVEVAIGPTKRVFYGMFHEFGSAYLSPKPFLRPAFDANVPKVLAGIRNRIAEEIEKARKRLARKAERLAAKMKNS